ncbi:MAG: proton-conducting transporter membrane subunit [Desulfuromonadaceae bacterium]|nr:proton-conducting transporter membrane subunit [Desulfuromonadaceae bacterium]MDD2848693.1 proton-conducting transporter membrane subunit [Desulfuromonadaceae bacterium]MDD4130804.1 proton-conducting transporter membrane subunit [Desulfuromonadaceae bacterium]
MLAALIILPLIGAATCWLIPFDRLRPKVLSLFSLAHFGITLRLLIVTPPESPGGWFHLDALGKIVLLSTSTLFLVCALYSIGYLFYRQERSNRALCMWLLVCLSAASLVTITHHLGLMWVALETTTISMAPLIYFNRNARSIEATWKYLLICSVGVALALIGLYFLAYATIVARVEPSLLLDDLIRDAGKLSSGWVHAAFVFLLVGFGTKMGLAPLHTWKPDAYGEAPGLVGALLSGGLVNLAFLALLRVYQLCLATKEIVFFQNALIVMGLFSMVMAAVFMARQADFKRMLAYSSVEHVGIMAVALGLGGKAIFGALFHILANGLTKGVLFLSSGNIHRSYNSKRTDQVRGVLRRLPWSGGIFLAGFIAITGSPPFAPFISEFTIISSAFMQGQMLVGAIFLLSLTVIFIGMALTVLPMVMGEVPADSEKTAYRDTFWTVGPPLALLLLMFLLGVWIPEPLMTLLRDAAALLEVPQ